MAVFYGFHCERASGIKSRAKWCVGEKKKKKIFKVEAALCHLLEVLPSFQCFKIIKVDYAEDQRMSAIARTLLY